MVTIRPLGCLTSAGCLGLGAALDAVCPYIPPQHCLVHKLPNVAGDLRQAQQRECPREVQAFDEAPALRQADARVAVTEDACVTPTDAAGLDADQYFTLTGLRSA